MARTTTRNEIAALVQGQSPVSIELVKGEGYWYFTASDSTRNIYDSHSVYTMRLSDQTPAEWAAIGTAFLNQVEQDYSDRTN